MDQSLNTLAQDWNNIFSDLLDQKPKHPINKYQPTPAYQNKISNGKKLNIGCGTSIFPYNGWTNIDHEDFTNYFNFVGNPNVPLIGMPEHQQQLANFLRDGGEMNFIKHNFNEPFAMIEDNYFDFIYCGQIIEHMTYINAAPKFLAECYRMLKTNGIIRITTPDFHKILGKFNYLRMNDFIPDQPDYYKDEDQYTQLSLLLFGAGGENCSQNKYEGHMHIYTEPNIKKLLMRIGFRDIQFYLAKEGHNMDYAKEVVDFGLSHSLIVEGVK